MIDEQQQDLVLQYLLGELDASQMEQVRAQIDSNPELRNFVTEMEETMASLAYSAKPLPAPESIPERILRAEGRRARPVAETPKQKVVFVRFVPWALAACLAIACAVLGLERTRLKEAFTKELAALREANSRTNTALAQLQQSSKELEKRVTGLQQENQDARSEIAALKERSAKDEQSLAAFQQKDAESQKELAALRQKDLLSQIRIATLKAQVAAYQQTNAVVVWDPDRKSGVLQLDKLPPAAAGKDYQLWVIDAKNPQPVSAGVLAVPNAGLIRTSFRPGGAVESAAAFAISVEKRGGSMKPEGQIILVGK